MVEKRKNPDITMTGAKNVREDILSYLEQYGEIKTANIWIRGLKVYQIDELKENIRKALEDEHIRGVVEIHLADRQINSPHLQYVGTKAERVEQILSELAVQMGFELTIDSAKSKNAIPEFSKYDKKARDDIENKVKQKDPLYRNPLKVIRTDEEYHKYKVHDEITKSKTFTSLSKDINRYFNESMTIIAKQRDKFLQMFKDVTAPTVERKRDLQRKKVEIREKDTSTLLDTWRDNRISRIRKRR